MGFPSEPLHDLQGAWKDALQNLSPQVKRSLYIHIPFCRTTCIFCPFHLRPASEKELSEYVDLLIAELKYFSDFENIKDIPINTVYFGGGTPTDLSAKQLERILKTVLKKFKLCNDCEITIEGRVNGFTKDKMLACIENGVNRFSIGIQSFSTPLRRSIGRIDEKEKLVTTLNTLSSFNQASVVIDLLYGLPNQTMSEWIDDNITALREVNISGLDHYRLNVYEGLKIYEMVKNAQIRLPSENEIFEMFKEGTKLLESYGAARLSIHHYSFNFRERNAHNELGAEKATCLQFGMKASGRLENYFFSQCLDLCEYRKMLQKKEKPLSYAGKLPPEFKICSELNRQIVKKRCIDPESLSKKAPLIADQIIEKITTSLENAKYQRFFEKSSFGIYKMNDEAIFNYKTIASELMDYLSELYVNFSTKK